MKAQLDLPAGFRFHPTDEELVDHYLLKKCASQTISVPIIAELDLYKFDPWQLPDMALYGEREWFFFTPRDRKYPNGSRPNRAAGTGYWKATGADKPVGKPKPQGIKKALVFYAGKAPRGIKTNWIMHEYRLANVDRSAKKNAGGNNSRLDDWVLCRIYNKKGIIEKYYPTDEKPAYQMTNALLPLKDEPQLDTSDSGPRQQHTDSSTCSEHVLSPDITCDKEVQSLPNRWTELDIDEALDAFDTSMFTPQDFFQSGGFAPQLYSYQYQMDQVPNTFSYSQRPF